MYQVLLLNLKFIPSVKSFHVFLTPTPSLWRSDTLLAEDIGYTHKHTLSGIHKSLCLWFSPFLSVSLFAKSEADTECWLNWRAECRGVIDKVSQKQPSVHVRTGVNGAKKRGFCSVTSTKLPTAAGLCLSKSIYHQTRCSVTIISMSTPYGTF